MSSNKKSFYKQKTKTSSEKKIVEKRVYKNDKTAEFKRNSIKYLHKSFFKAKKLGLLNPYMFYLTLKSVGKGGTIKYGEVSPTINKHFKLSKAIISKYMKICIEKGFIIPIVNKKGDTLFYSIVSYQKVWSILGFDISEPNENNNIRWTDNKILKVNIGKCNNLKDIINTIIVEELRYDQFIQKKTRENQSGDDKNNQQDNFDSSEALSCKTLAQKFGFKSPMTGSRLRNQLNNDGLIQLVEMSNILIKRGVKYVEFCEMYLKDNTLHFFKGCVFKQLCYRIFFKKVPYHFDKLQFKQDLNFVFEPKNILQCSL